MKDSSRTVSRRNVALVALLLLAVMVVIFIADTITDFAVAAAVFYIAVILVAARLLPPAGVVALTSACVIFTVLSFILTHSGAYEVGLVNTGISVVAIAITAYLSLRLVAAEAAEYETRERLLRMARITSLGELTASIAHEVNQPLAAISASAGAARRWLEQPEPQVENGLKAIARISTDADRAAAVIARVRGLAKGEAPMRSVFDLNALALELVALARPQIDREDVSLLLYLDEKLPQVDADRVQLGQVIVNLLLNAIEAVGAVDFREIEVTTSANANRVRLSVADSGAGLQPEDAARLFDAFWTTKKDGIGLGLTISRSIIEGHGGRIWAEPRPEGGSIFAFELPFAAREAS